jgi:hypothetical protein
MEVRAVGANFSPCEQAGRHDKADSHFSQIWKCAYEAFRTVIVILPEEFWFAMNNMFSDETQNCKLKVIISSSFFKYNK